MARGIDVVRKYDLPDDELDAKVQEAFAELETGAMEKQYEASVREFSADTILSGKVLNVVNQDVIVDIGYKSEGVIPLSEFGENADVDIGDTIEVLLDEIDATTGMIRLSKRKADRIRAWNEILKTHKEGDVVRGMVTRKIKGGLLLDVGVPVFLPASQVSLRRTADISVTWYARSHCSSSSSSKRPGGGPPAFTTIPSIRPNASLDAAALNTFRSRRIANSLLSIGETSTNQPWPAAFSSM